MSCPGPYLKASRRFPCCPDDRDWQFVLNRLIVGKPLLKFSVGIDRLSSKFCEGEGPHMKESFFIANDYRVVSPYCGDERSEL